VQDALTALDAAFQRIAITDQEVKAAKELADGEAERFQAGDSNLIFVNLREQNAADAEIRQVDALLDYQRAMIAFEAILARSAAPSPLS
jgi:outer membrane protein TolC